MKHPDPLHDIYEQIERMTKLLEVINEKIEGKEFRTETDKNGYFTTPEVMEYLGVSENTLKKMRRQGKIEFMELCNCSYRYPKRQFDQQRKAA